MSANPHQYQRDVFSAHAESLSKLSARMVRGSEVLELGPAAGYFTRILKSTLQCTIDAIEIDPSMAQKAKPHCRDMVVADIDTLDWTHTFAGRRYDAIVAADVLEHLREPERALRALRARLKPGGRLFVSLPNIAYAGMIFGLLDDDFRYRPEGLLDQTHLRFFTRTTLEQTLARCGWGVTWRGEVRKDLYEAEFHTRIERWPPAVREFILEHPRRAAYQLLCEAGPIAIPDEKRRDEIIEPARLRTQWSARLMWADSPEQLTFDHGVVAFGDIGATSQTLEFRTLTAAKVLRIRLSDRNGFLNLHGISVTSPNEIPTAQKEANISILECERSADITTLDASTWALASDEAWLQLPRGDYPEGTVVRLLCGWPMSPEYAKAVTLLRESEAASAQTIDALRSERSTIIQRAENLESLVVERDDLLKNTNEHVLHLESIASEREALVQARDALLEQTNERARAFEAKTKTLERELQQRTQERDDNAEARDALSQRIAQLRSFREWWAHRFSK